MSVFIYPPYQVTVDTGTLASAAKQDEQTAILQQIENNTDGLETSLSSVDTKLSTTNTTLSDIDTSLNNIEAVNFATEAKQDSQIAELQDIEADLEAGNILLTSIDTSLNSLEAVDFSTQAKQDDIITELQFINAYTAPFVGDLLDSPLLDTSGSNIPASSGNPLEVVASTSVEVIKLVIVEDIGEFIGLYTGPALSETLMAVLPLGGGELPVNIPQGTRVSLRAMENTAISSGKIAINFLA